VAIDYTSITAALVRTVQELADEIDQLKERRDPGRP
jgi:hypothetical protein